MRTFAELEKQPLAYRNHLDLLGKTSPPGGHFVADNPLPYRREIADADHHVDNPRDCIAPGAAAAEGRTADRRTVGCDDLRRKIAGLAGIRGICNGDEKSVLSRSATPLRTVVTTPELQTHEGVRAKFVNTAAQTSRLSERCAGLSRST